MPRGSSPVASSSGKAEDGVLELSIGPVRTGRYWVKAVWDKVDPHEYNLFSSAACFLISNAVAGCIGWIDR